jgi:hypothetical protein
VLSEIAERGAGEWAGPFSYLGCAEWLTVTEPQVWINSYDGWVVERTFAWLSTFRRLSRDFEQHSNVSEAWIYAAMSRLLLRRLAK